MKIYNKRVREFRELLNLSREEYADQTGIAMDTLVLIEEGKQNAELDDILKIVFTYGVSADYLCGMEDTPVPFGKSLYHKKKSDAPE